MAPRGAVPRGRVRALEDGHRAESIKAREGADACIISERDDDNALFGAAVDVLEALIASYGAVRPYAGPANVLVRGADDGFVSLAIPLEAVRDAYGAGGVSADCAGALARGLWPVCPISVDAAGVADLFGDTGLDLEHAASDAEVAAAAEAEKTLAVALEPGGRGRRARPAPERAGAALADGLLGLGGGDDARAGSRTTTTTGLFRPLCLCQCAV